VSALALGHIPPGICNAMQLSDNAMGVPVLFVVSFVLAWAEPLDVHSAWWVRAALPVFIMLPPQIALGCACAGHQAVCTRQAWSTFTSEVGLVAFLAPRVAVGLSTIGALWWLGVRARSAEARRGDKSKQE
jgi:hypothetical protein